MSLMTNVFFEGARVRVRLLHSNYEIWFEHNDNADEIRAREGNEYAVPVRIRLVNRKSGKDLRGFSPGYLHPWWLRRFVFDLAAAVAYTEREWDTMSPAYVAKMEQIQQQQEVDTR